MKFDKLNKLEDFDYFEPMALSDDDKNRRRDLCDYLTDAFLYFFSVYEVHKMYNSMLAKALYEQLLTDKISDAVAKVTGIDSEMSQYIRKLSKEVVDTTIKHEEKNTQVGQNSPDDSNSLTALQYNPDESVAPSPESNSNNAIDSLIGYSDEALSEDDDEVEEMMENEAVMDYWLSIHRAVNIAQNEANTFLNYSDYLDAKDKGKTQKTWLTMLDNKVRNTHDEVEGQTIGIDELFQVGNSEMRFPHDWMFAPDPKETVNCRCSVDYK